MHDRRIASLSPAVRAKSAVLDEMLGGLERVFVAYSGGVDSSFLMARAGKALGASATAVTAVSPSMSRRSLGEARELARKFGWSHLTIETHEVADERYARNAPDRCYWCKTELYSVLGPLAAQREATMLVGTNLDDLDDVRPGHRAARENGVRAPLVDAGLVKDEIRQLSAAMGLPTAHKPAGPCLASRFAYGVRVTPEGLDRVDRAEEHLRSLGFEDLRVRDHGNLARIEVPAERVEEAAALREQIAARLAALGFNYVTLDLQGLRSGSLNETLAPPTIRGPDA